MYKITKADKGRTLWFVPTGNMVNRWGENKNDAYAQAQELEVVTVGRRFVHVMKRGDLHTTKLEINSSDYHYDIADGCNSGLIPFESREAMFNERKMKALRRRIFGLTGAACDVSHLGYDEMLKIAEIIGLTDLGDGNETETN